MKIRELRAQSKEDLLLKLSSSKEELGKLKYLARIGQVDKPHQFRSLKRTIARINTLLGESAVEKKV